LIRLRTDFSQKAKIFLFIDIRDFVAERICLFDEPLFMVVGILDAGRELPLGIEPLFCENATKGGVGSELI